MLLKMQSERKSVRLENLQELLGQYINGEMLAVEIAYQEVPWFRAAIDHRANAFSNVPFDLLELDGDVIANDSDYEEELVDNQKINIFPILPQLMRDLDMHGAAYADFESNAFGRNSRWRRLHPASIKPEYNTATGELLHFRRNTGNVNNRTMPIKPDDKNFLWLWMPERAREFFPGDGVGKTALRAATTLNNTDIFQSTFFKQGALNPTILQIQGWATTDEDEKQRVTGVLQRLMSGVRNAFRIVPLDADVKVMSLMQNLKDMAMAELTTQQRENISTATGVPHSMLFSNAANYATAQQDDFNFYDKTIVPFAVWVMEPQLNAKLFKRLNLRIKYRKERLEVYQRLEVDKVDKLVLLLTNGVMDIAEIRKQINLPEREEEEFEVPPRLVNQEDGLDTEEPVDTQESGMDTQESGMDTQEENPPTKRTQAEQKALANDRAAYAYIPLANNAEIIRIVQRLKDRLDDSRIEWQSAPTYHVTLCYAKLVNNEQINLMAQLLRPIETELIGGNLDIFETPEGKALHIRLENSEILGQLQAHVYDVFGQVGAGGLSDFSNPTDYKPHITLAYLPNDINWDIEPIHFRSIENCVIVGRDDYEPALIVEAPKRIVLDEYNVLKTDFHKWEQKALKRFAEGKPEKMLEFESQHVSPVQKAAIIGALELAQSSEDVKAIFAEAVEVAPLWGMYA